MSVGTSSKHCKMCCTNFNIERKEVIYEAVFSLQYHSYTSKLCRVVDIARALLHSCSCNKSMQLLNVLSVVRSQGMFNKAT